MDTCIDGHMMFWPGGALDKINRGRMKKYEGKKL